MWKFQSIAIICCTVGFVSLLQVVLRYLEVRQRRQAPPALGGIDERLARIELAVESTAVEVERIAEANRFMSRLLADRPGVVVPSSRPERVVTPH